MIVDMKAGISCDGDLGDLDVSTEIKFNCYNNKITDLGVSNQIQGIVVTTNLTLFTLNVDLSLLSPDPTPA